MKNISEYSKGRIKQAIDSIQPEGESLKVIWKVAEMMFALYGEDVAVFWSPENDEIHFDMFDESEMNVGVTVKIWNGRS